VKPLSFEQTKEKNGTVEKWPIAGKL